MSLFQFVHYWALYTPSRRFDINSRLKKLSFSWTKLHETHLNIRDKYNFFLGNVTVWWLLLYQLESKFNKISF